MVTEGQFEPCAPLELKIKAKSLAAEARIIKNLERRLKRRYAQVVPTHGIDLKTGGVRVVGHTGVGRKRKGLTEPRTLAQFTKLQQHRKIELRQEARATQLARAFLKGMAYSRVECDAKAGRGLWGRWGSAGGSGFPAPLVAAIHRLAEKYSDQDKRIVAQRFAEWLADATKWIMEPRPTKGGAENSERP